MKNRQKVVLDGLGKIKKPEKSQFPQLLANYQPAKMMNKHIDSAIKKHTEIKKKIENVLVDPSHHDRVFQSFTRIFNANTPLNLRRPDKARFAVRNLARKRFALGYPPRKSGDTSFGDAINWEWIIRCAENGQQNENILIVSRDGDYGITYDGGTILNDWLKREFKDRVGLRRKVELTNKLTVALKQLDEVVTEAEEKEEEKIIASSPRVNREKPRSVFGELFLEKLLEDASGKEPTLGEILAEYGRENIILDGGIDDGDQ